MNVKLHIDRLVLDGFSLSRRQSTQLKAAVETRLTQLLANNDGQMSWTANMNFKRLQARDIHFTGNETPSRLGGRIANTVFRRIVK